MNLVLVTPYINIHDFNRLIACVFFILFHTLQINFLKSNHCLCICMIISFVFSLSVSQPDSATVWHAKQGLWEGGFQPVHWSGTRRANKEGPLTLAIDILFRFFHIVLVSLTIFSLFSCVIWTFFCCTGNKTFMKVYPWFYWTSNPQLWEK
jgi:hypothetical protein